MQLRGKLRALVTPSGWVAACAGLTLLALSAVSSVAPSARAEDRVLNIYNWTDYIDPAVLERFQKETGITVRYDVFDSLETLEAKLLAGHSGYDIVVPSNEPTFSRLIKVGALARIDRARVPNWSNLDAALMHRVENSDPGNQYGAIYLWGTTGIGLIPDRVKKLASNAPMDSWDVLFKPEFAKADVKVSHEAGTLGACHNVEADTAACRFYITLCDAPFLDGNFTVFGKVTQGLDVARRISKQPLILDDQDAEGSHRPEKPITIKKVTIQTSEAEAGR